MSTRALINHMSIPCDKTFRSVFYPWPWILIHFFKTLTLLITFEQWVLDLWYFTRVFLVMKPFCGYHYFLSCDLDLGVWSIFDPFFLWKNWTLLITFEQWVIELCYSIWVFQVTKLVSRYLSLWLELAIIMGICVHIHVVLYLFC